jgi:hypothetical protein
MILGVADMDRRLAGDVRRGLVDKGHLSLSGAVKKYQAIEKG